MVKGFYAIDAHCHIYPEKIAQKAVAGTDAFYSTTAAGTGVVSDLMEMGKKAGIDHFVVQSVATTPKQVTSINEFIAKSVGESNGLLTGLGTLHPDSDDIKGDVDKIVSLGLHGVKLHPDIQRFAVDDDKCLEMYQQCSDNGLPVLMHTGDYRYDFSNPDRVENVLKTFPKLTLVGAHLGGWSVWEEAVQKLSKYDNLVVDCSSTFPFTTMERAKNAFYQYSTDRILFGTDYPMWSPVDEMKTFLSLDLTDSDLEKILSKNAIRVFNIK